MSNTHQRRLWISCQFDLQDLYLLHCLLLQKMEAIIFNGGNHFEGFGKSGFLQSTYSGPYRLTAQF